MAHDRASETLRRRARRRSLLTSPLVVGALGGVVALAAALAIGWLNSSADQRRTSQLALAALDRDTLVLHSLTAEAVRSGLTPEVQAGLDASGERADRTMSQAARSRANDPAVGELLDLALGYRAAATALLSRVGTGDASAGAAFEGELQPRFARFEQRLDEAGAEAGQKAEDAAALARTGTMIVLALAAGLVALLLWRFDRARRAAHEAFYDPLTGLANRMLFADRLEHGLALAARRGERVGVFFLDLDEFKAINDSFGHSAGDELLLAVAERLTATTRATDTIARLGGDEFAFLVEGVDESRAERFAERVQEALAPVFVVDGRRVAARATIGCALSSARSSADDLLRDADLAMYAGKRQGKNRLVFYEPSMYEALADRIELEADLAGALARGELSLVYQPIVDVVSGRLMSFEALARWNHPERGVIAPSVFIPIAESNGAIGEIGRWALDEACAQAARWQREHPGGDPVGVSVNVSPVQLAEPEIVEDVRHALDASGLDPVLLTLEITESVFVERGEAFVERLRGLSALGVRLAIDDFGTGYSSLSSLAEFPVNELKIDRAFVAGMQARPDGEALVRSIVQLGSSLGLRAVAEGVELDGQAEAIEGLGCGLAQGFHYARPMASEDIAGFLAGERVPVPSLRPPSPPADEAESSPAAA